MNQKVMSNGSFSASNCISNFHTACPYGHMCVLGHAWDILWSEYAARAIQKRIADVENCAKHLVPTTNNSWTKSYLDSVCEWWWAG